MTHTNINTQEILNKLAEGQDLTTSELDYITHTNIDIRIERLINEVRAYVKTPYNGAFVNAIHNIKDAKWDPANQEWSVPASEIDELRKIVTMYYGTTKGYAPVSIITIQLKNDYDSYFYDGETDIKFHGKLICSAGSGDAVSTYYADSAYPMCNLYHMSKVKNTHLTMKSGIEFAIVMNKDVAESLRLFEDDDLFKVVDYKTIEPIHEMVVEYEKINETQHLIKQRETLLKDLAQVNEELSKRGFPEVKNDNGTLAEIDINKDEKRKKEIRREERRKIRDLRRQSKTDPSKLEELVAAQDAYAAEKAKDAEKEAQREAEAEKKTHIYISPADILGATQKAIIVKFNTSSFWFPKGYVKKVTENDKCWLDLKLAIWMSISDAENQNKSISESELRTVYGDVNKAKTTGDEDDLDLALEGKYQPDLEIKEVEADANLKR